MSDPTPEQLLLALGRSYDSTARNAVEPLRSTLAEREGTIVRLVKEADEMRKHQQEDHTTMTALRARTVELEDALVTAASEPCLSCGTPPDAD